MSSSAEEHDIYIFDVAAGPFTAPFPDTISRWHSLLIPQVVICSLAVAGS